MLTPRGVDENIHHTNPHSPSLGEKRRVQVKEILSQEDEIQRLLNGLVYYSWAGSGKSTKKELLSLISSGDIRMLQIIIERFLSQGKDFYNKIEMDRDFNGIKEALEERISRLGYSIEEETKISYYPNKRLRLPTKLQLLQEESLAG